MWAGLHPARRRLRGGGRRGECGHRGQSAGPLVGRDSNPGKVTVSMGGVGRNIAHNLRLLGVKVSLLTALGEDPHAGQVMDSCERLGIDLSRALHVPGGTTSTYLFLSDETGDMALAVSDMGIYEELTPAYFARGTRGTSTGRPWWWPTPICPPAPWPTWPTTAPRRCWWTRCPR